MINFPSNPTDGQEFQSGSTIYTYSLSKNYWRSEKTTAVTPTETALVFGSPDDLMLMGQE